MKKIVVNVISISYLFYFKNGLIISIERNIFFQNNIVKLRQKNAISQKKYGILSVCEPFI